MSRAEFEARLGTALPLSVRAFEAEPCQESRARASFVEPIAAAANAFGRRHLPDFCRVSEIPTVLAIVLDRYCLNLSFLLF